MSNDVAIRRSPHIFETDPEGCRVAARHDGDSGTFRPVLPSGPDR